MSSCTAYLPEFHRAEMLDVGENRGSVGAYYGGHIDDQLVPGVAAFYSVGVTEHREWSTIASLGRFSLRNGEFMAPDILVATGPKWSRREGMAFAFPVGIFQSWYSDDPAMLLMPAAYFELYPNRHQKRWAGTVFLRSEVMFSNSWRWYGIMGGFKVESKHLPWHPAINFNASPVGGAVGYTMDLF